MIHIQKASKAKPTPKAQVTLLGSGKTVQKADVAGLVINGTESMPADDFFGSYMTESTTQGAAANSILEPNIKPGTLLQLVTTNNILGQCIEAMEVNIDGTGHQIVKKDQEDGKEDKAQLQMLKDFFNEPYPGKSMVSIRREMRRDLESTGCGYLEVGRSMAGEITTLNYMQGDQMRLLRLDDPVEAKKTLTRNGKEVEITLRVRERRFVQLVNGKRVFFKEFGASRELNRHTGEWAKPGEAIAAKDRASEVLYFHVNREPKTPYGSPRWINQLPSVLGSRKAEEYNLDFFDAGGLPPVLVLVQGGYLGTGMKETLESHLGGAGSKHRAAVVEAIAASGSLDSAGSVKVTVERFGTERQQDSMFQNYDQKCEEHVRCAFRLPPLFLGKAQDYNFATAQTGYMTAEAQVFAPERTEFDERMNALARAMGAKDYIFKSNPITLKDADRMIKALELALENKMVKGESAIKELNELTGTNMEYQDPPDPVDETAKTTEIQTESKLTVMDKQHEQSKEMQDRTAKLMAQQPQKPEEKPGAKQKPALKVVKYEDPVAPAELVQLAEKWMSCLGISGFKYHSEEHRDEIIGRVSALKGDDLKAFNAFVASRCIVNVENSLEGLSELAGCAGALMEAA